MTHVEHAASGLFHLRAALMFVLQDWCRGLLRGAADRKPSNDAARHFAFGEEASKNAT